jgi:hypothetical protein
MSGLFIGNMGGTAWIIPRPNSSDAIGDGVFCLSEIMEVKN